MAVLQPVARQHHHRPVHARDDVEGDHRAPRRAVVDVGAGLGRLPAQLDLLAGRDERECAAAERAGRRVEVDVVIEDVALRVLQRELDVVALVADHQRPRNRAVEGQHVEHGAVVVDLPLVLDGGELHLDDLRPAARDLLMGRHEGRGDKLLLHPGKAAQVHFAGRGQLDRDRGRGGAEGAPHLQNVAPVHVQHGWCLLLDGCPNACARRARTRIAPQASPSDRSRRRPLSA